MKKFCSVMLLLLLAACSGSDQQQELHAYVDKIKSKPAGEVEPLPDIKPYEPYQYSAMSLRSPFKMPEPLEKAFAGANGIHPDLARPKEELEKFPLDSLKMLGTLEKQNKRWAVIRDPDGILHRVTIGNYIGLNHGKIIEISQDKIKILQLISDGDNGWQEQDGWLTLSEK